MKSYLVIFMLIADEAKASPEDIHIHIHGIGKPNDRIVKPNPIRQPKGEDVAERVAMILKQIESIKMQMASGQEISEIDDQFGLLESSAECDALSKGIFCFTGLFSAARKCMEVMVNPTEIVSCVETAIGAGSGCIPCVCKAVETVFRE